MSTPPLPTRVATPSPHSLKPLLFSLAPAAVPFGSADRFQERGMGEQFQELAGTSRKNGMTTTTSSRRTRSQGVPDWTEQETLILVGEVIAVDDGWMKSLSSYQRWKMISDNCVGLDVNRSSSQCKRKWESLLADFRKIRGWESCSGAGASSYWSLDGERRKKHGLPALFYEEVFGLMEAVFSTLEVQPGSQDSDSEDANAEVPMFESDDARSGYKEQLHDKTTKETTEVRDMADKLRKSAEHVHAILEGELADDTNGTRAAVDLLNHNAMEVEFTRRQADELISALGDMVGTFNRFTELIKDVESKEI